MVREIIRSKIEKIKKSNKNACYYMCCYWNELIYDIDIGCDELGSDSMDSYCMGEMCFNDWNSCLIEEHRKCDYRVICKDMMDNVFDSDKSYWKSILR